MKPIHIFSPGTQTAMDGRSITFSEADLATAASAYDPAIHEAPMVIGHPKTDAPAYGWVKGLSVVDGKLTAEPDQLNPEFAEMVGNGAFKKVSASFYLPQAKGNPTPGRLALRHVGFLGAKAPAVKGLDPIEFGDADDGVVEFAVSTERAQASAWNTVAWLLGRLRDKFIEQDGLEKADEVLPSYALQEFRQVASDMRTDDGDTPPAFADPTPTDQETTMSGTDDKELEARAATLATQEAELKARQEKLDKQAADFAEAEVKSRRAENEAHLDALIADGKFAPGLKDQTLEFMDTLDPSDTIEFGEGDDAEKTTPLDYFRDLLGKSGTVINFGEISADDQEADAGTVNFASPDGYEVDPAQLALHNKAVAHQAAHPNTPYLDAVRAVGG
ncbi:Phage protein [Candidatus Phaeomarinobacter ectocarpi]|uniref:Phage protein n=1 Tax=Candidatus Phaeomarinibacter ectocarpi TaxID=1458461 RepID=X5MP28_9HYPH|nr:phage protease [Candidatus Phaeomarinobacter ectocarpi]CDO60816.1 Phage protein [Candidatus Phaeomarinobacter ectocarpi]